MSFGQFAVLLGGWFYGRLVGMANQLLAWTNKIGAVILYGTMTMALFAGVRSLLDLILISYVIIAWVVELALSDGAWIFRPRSSVGKTGKVI